MIPLVLASASPRRRRLLEQIGLSFRIVPARVPEALARDCHPIVGVMEVANRSRGGCPAGICRIDLRGRYHCAFGGGSTGKAGGHREATAMLTRLEGKKHEVITGVALRDAATGRCLLEYEATSVRMRSLTPEEIENYVATGEPLDKAGAYGIQGRGALLIRGIEGCYFNVVGLPLARVARMLECFGFDLWSDKGRYENAPGVSLDH